MTEGEMDRFRVAISLLGVTYGAEMSEARFEAYWVGLGDLDIEAVERAVRTAIRSPGRFMPTPGDLRELAGVEPAKHLAVRAWLAVRAAIRSHGGWTSVQFDDPAVTAAVRAVGGWVSLCSAETEELDRFRGREFELAYQGFARAGVRPAEAAPLDGWHAIESSVSGYSPPPVQRIRTGLPPAPMLPGMPPATQRRLGPGAEPVLIGELLGMEPRS